MATPSTLTVNDGAATPVAHDFIPGPRTDGVQYFLNSNGVKIGDKTITVSQRKVGTKYKPRVVIAIPIVQDETVNGVTNPKVVRTGYADITFTFENLSTEQERDDVVAFMANLLAPGQTEVRKVIADLEYWNS